MLVHLGGTTIPSPSVPLLMVTMDADQGIQLIRLIEPDITVPIHYEYVPLSGSGFDTRGKRIGRAGNGRIDPTNAGLMIKQ